jgi:hypothetical protein
MRMRSTCTPVIIEVHVWLTLQELRLRDHNHVGMLSEEDLS